jgi:Tfp pilus assembly protein PilZ
VRPQPAAAPRQAPAQAAQPAPQNAQRAKAASGDFSPVTAELGAHSPSNFYKGLSGNDIIDHGGLFVSTYRLPKIGQPVRLRVSLPGGYEFEANAVVRWRREASDAGNDAPPGFGAQFTEITAEARQLVYRYVRNREPLFHDDF